MAPKAKPKAGGNKTQQYNTILEDFSNIFQKYKWLHKYHDRYHRL